MPLNETDKAWLSGQLSRIEERLNGMVTGGLSGVEERLNGVVNGGLSGVEERLNGMVTGGLSGIEERLNAKLEPLATREDVFDTETKLLLEFRKWASPADMRMRAQSASIRALEAELEAVKDRLSELEGNKGTAS